eukprot:SAG11_NODE_9253_length_928_cov_1.168878_1_plen_62_part_00
MAQTDLHFGLEGLWCVGFDVDGTARLTDDRTGIDDLVDQVDGTARLGILGAKHRGVHFEVH